MNLDTATLLDSDAASVRLASDHEVLWALAESSRQMRLLEAQRVRLAGEVARRSEGAGDESLARRQGTTGAADLVAQVAGVRRQEAGTLVAIGKATRPREALTGDVLPPERPHVAAAFAAGKLDRAVAAALLRCIKKCEGGLTPEELHELERQLVQRALDGTTADDLLGFFKRVPDYAHPEGAKAREDELQQLASVSKQQLDNGLTRWILDLDPLTNGYFQAALEANTPRSTFQIRSEDEPALTEDEQDTRPLRQKRVDAIRELSRKVLKVEDGQIAGTAVTMLVHIGLFEFITGIGAAAIDGCEGTISASTARRLAAEAEIIPIVLGGNSQPLDLGETRRFFTEAQRRAMAARDKGCAGPSAMHPSPGPRRRTSCPLDAGAPRSGTGSCSVPAATSSSTNAAGRSDATTADGGGPHHPASTPPEHHDPADHPNPSDSDAAHPHPPRRSRCERSEPRDPPVAGSGESVPRRTFPRIQRRHSAHRCGFDTGAERPAQPADTRPPRDHRRRWIRGIRAEPPLSSDPATSLGAAPAHAFAHGERAGR